MVSCVDDIDYYNYFAATMSVLDKSVGQVIDALARKDMLDNTIVLFLSDNGGPTVGLHNTTASNYPLRGQKNSPWEGGIRSSAAIWSRQFEHQGRVWKQPIYIGDFLPTLADAAGIQIDPKLKLDGLNLWSALKYGYEAVEREIVHNIDDIVPYVSYLMGKWKLINGTTSTTEDYDGWLGTRLPADSEENDPRAVDYEDIVRNTTVWQQLQRYNEDESPPNVTALRIQAAIICSISAGSNVGTPCDPTIGLCLYDIDADPCEKNNLYEDYKNSGFLLDMLARINLYRRNAHPPNNKPGDSNSDPKYYDYEWTWWEDLRDDASTLKIQSASLVAVLIFIVINLSNFVNFFEWYF